jgi:hypothetical protein
LEHVTVFTTVTSQVCWTPATCCALVLVDKAPVLEEAIIYHRCHVTPVGLGGNT